MKNKNNGNNGNGYRPNFLTRLADMYLLIGSITEKYAKPEDKSSGLAALDEPSALEKTAEHTTMLADVFSGKEIYVLFKGFGGAGSGL